MGGGGFRPSRGHSQRAQKPQCRPAHCQVGSWHHWPPPQTLGRNAALTRAVVTDPGLTGTSQPGTAQGAPGPGRTPHPTRPRLQGLLPKPTQHRSDSGDTATATSGWEPRAREHPRGNRFWRWGHPTDFRKPARPPLQPPRGCSGSRGRAARLPPVTQPPYGILISEEAPAAPAVAPGQERPSPRWEAPPPACTPFTIIIDFSKYQI